MWVGYRYRKEVSLFLITVQTLHKTKVCLVSGPFVSICVGMRKWVLGAVPTVEQLPLLMPFSGLGSHSKWSLKPFVSHIKKKCTFIALESHLTLNQDQLFLLHGTPHSLPLAQSGLAIFEMPSWPRRPVICPNWRGPKIYLPEFLKTAPSAEPSSQMKAYLGRHIWSSEQIVLKEPTIQCLVSTVAHICKHPGSSWCAVKAAGF